MLKTHSWFLEWIDRQRPRTLTACSEWPIRMLLLRLKHNVICRNLLVDWFFVFSWNHLERESWLILKMLPYYLCALRIHLSNKISTSNRINVNFNGKNLWNHHVYACVVSGHIESWFIYITRAHNLICLMHILSVDSIRTHDADAVANTKPAIVEC